MSTEALQAYRGMNYEIAEAIAPSWEGQREFVEQVAAPAREWLVRELRAKPGDRVLELAAGTGDTGFEVAAAIGASGRLITTDFSPTMLDGARRRGAELGVENVEYRVIDAERIELADDSVDGILCRFGYMLMGDPAAALAESRRVLRAGGRLVLAVWGAPERNPFFTAAVLSLVRHGHAPPPDPSGPGLFSMAGADRTTHLLEGAGFDDVRTAELPVRFEVRDADEYLRVVADTAGSIALVVRALDAEARETVKADAEAALERFAGKDGYVIPGVALCAVAR